MLVVLGTDEDVGAGKGLNDMAHEGRPSERKEPGVPREAHGHPVVDPKISILELPLEPPLLLHGMREIGDTQGGQEILPWRRILLGAKALTILAFAPLRQEGRCRGAQRR